MAVNPDGDDLRVVETGVRNGEGLAVAPDGSVWTAVNERDNVTYPFHSSYAGHADAFGQVIQAYVNGHPPDEVSRVTAGRNLGWPYCNPDQDENHPAGSLADVPFVPDAVTNPGGIHLDCAALTPVEVGLPAHSAPLGMSFLEGSAIPASSRPARRPFSGWRGTPRSTRWSPRSPWSPDSRTRTAAAGRSRKARR